MNKENKFKNTINKLITTIFDVGGIVLVTSLCIIPYFIFSSISIILKPFKNKNKKINDNVLYVDVKKIEKEKKATSISKEQQIDELRRWKSSLINDNVKKHTKRKIR